MKCCQMERSSLSLGNGPYQGGAGRQWCCVDSRPAVCVCVCVKPGPGVVDRVQSRQPWVILWDCLDSFHGKLDEGSSTRAEGSGDVIAFNRLDSTWAEQTIQLKAVRVKELRKRKINKSYSCSAQVLSWAIFRGVGGGGGGQLRADFTAFLF